MVEAAKAFLSSWFGQVSGVLRVAGTGPIGTTDTAVFGERMVSFSVRQGTVDLTAPPKIAVEDFHRNLSALCDIQETSLLELLLAAPCLVDRLNTDFGSPPQLVWILGPLLERALLQVDPLITLGSWWTLSAWQSATALSKYDRAAFARAFVEASRVRNRTCSVLSVAVDDSRVGARTLENWCHAGPCHQLRSTVGAPGHWVKHDTLFKDEAKKCSD